MAIARVKGEKTNVAFNAGEWAIELFGRFDLEKYNFACQQLQNHILLPYGGAVRRAGTQFRANCAFDDKKSRLIGYNFSTTTSYTLELADLKMRFFKDGAQIMSGPSPFEIVTPWVESELFEVQFNTINDVIYFTHKDKPPQKLIRFADDNWTIQDTAFKTPALLPENLTAITLTPTATTGAITVNASAAVFQALHVGSFWQLQHIRPAVSTTRSLTATGTSAVIVARGEATFSTTGRWDGVVQVQAQDPVTGVWETIREFTSTDASHNFEVVIERDELDIDTALRINYTNGVTPTPGTSPATAHLTVPSTLIDGLVKITNFISSTSVDADVVTPLQSTASTTNWSEGAWSDVRGYPRAISMFELRIIYGGSRNNPQTVWGTKVDDFEDLGLGASLDTDGLRYTFASPEQNAIQWIIGHNRMLIGTTGGEWTMGATNSDDPLTPSNIRISRHASYGSKYLQASSVNDVVLFVQRIGLKIREFVEDDIAATLKYKAPDLTLLAKHITEGEVIQTAYSQQPDSVFWTVTGKGRIAGMTYEREQNIAGWHRQETDGEFESVATIYGPTGDEVWVTVKRTINGVTKRYVERLNPFIWENGLSEQDKKENMFFVDSGITTAHPKLTTEALVLGLDYKIIDIGVGMDLTNVGGQDPAKKFKIFTATASAVPTSYGGGILRRVQRTFTGLDHLEGKTVQILGDGNVVPDQIVTGGQITLPEPEDRSSVTHIGLKFTSKLQPMNLDIDSNAGAHPGSKKQMRQVIPSFQDSIGGSYSTNILLDDNETPKVFKIPFRDTVFLMDESPPLFTGPKVELIEQEFSLTPDIVLIQDQPLPQKINILTVKHEVTDES